MPEQRKVSQQGGDAVSGLLPGDRFRPFSNGTEHLMWEARNCRRGEGGCRHYKPDAESSRNGCPIEVAIAMASVSDGTIPAKTALRGGFLEPGSNGTLARVDQFPPECPEYKGYDEPDDRPRRGPKPPAGQQDLLDPRHQPLSPALSRKGGSDDRLKER